MPRDPLSDASDNSRAISDLETLLKRWRNGDVPRDHAEALQWAQTITRGRRRATRIVKASDVLVGILAVKLTQAGMSGRAVGRALGVPPTSMHRLVQGGRASIARGRMSDGPPPAPPVGSDGSN